MFRVALRLVGWLALAGGFVVLIINGTQTIAVDQLVLTKFGTMAQAVLGARYDAMAPALAARHVAFIWNPFLTSVFAAPAFGVLMVLGILAVLATPPRKKLIGYSSRP